jgi:DNA-binding SARP family transcriptional activator
MSRLEFRLLGPLEAVEDDRILALGGTKQRALLAVLLLHANQAVSNDRLIDEVWGESPPATAAKIVQIYVSRLRKQFGDERLLTRPPGYLLRVAPAELDLARFERLVAEARQEDAAAAAAKLREALELWRGPPLADLAYERFAQAEIVRLEELRWAALEQRIDADLALGRHRQVVAELEALVAGYPLRERLRSQLMLALYQSGRKADALEAYREGRQRSIEELGLEPGTELRELESRILADSPELAAPPAFAGRVRAAQRGPLVLAISGLLLAGVVAGVFLREHGGGSRAAVGPAIDVAANAVAGLDAAAGGRPAFAVPLPGRATDLAADGDQLFAVTIDSSALTIVDGRTRRLARTIPLPMRPAAVAARGGSVWIADGRRGLLVRMDAGYQHVASRAVWRRPVRRGAVGLSRSEPTAVALAGGFAWVTDGSERLVRSDARGRVSRFSTPHPLDGIASGAGALWAISSADAAVVRIDPRTGAVTDDIPIVRGSGSKASAPIAIAATASAVWVLNGNTATVSRIDASTRAVSATIPLALEASPRDIEAAVGAVWVSSFDGSVTRIPPAGGEPRSSFVGESLVGVAGSPRRLWVAAVALDQQIPGGQ